MNSLRKERKKQKRQTKYTKTKKDRRKLTVRRTKHRSSQFLSRKPVLDFESGAGIKTTRKLEKRFSK